MLKIMRIAIKVFSIFMILAANIASAETLTYNYDSMQRITRVQYASGPVIEYVYDNMGNRLAQSAYTAGTPANNPPNPATLSFPANGAIGIASPMSFSWSGSDPNPGDSLSYFVYAGTNANTLKLVWSGHSTSFSPWSLLPNTTYYWKVVTRDNHNAEVSSGLPWSFTTGNTIVNGLPVNLSVYLSGTGGGTVTSVAPHAGIVCTGAAADICSQDFSAGSQVSLSAVLDGVSRFGGWSEAACATNPVCALTLTEDRIISAAFDGVPPVRITLSFSFSFPGMPQLPPIELDSLYPASVMIQNMTQAQIYTMGLLTHNLQFDENFDFNSGTQQVLWRGGYTGDYSTAPIGTTILRGILTIQGGTLIVDRITIK